MGSSNSSTRSGAPNGSKIEHKPINDKPVIDNTFHLYDYKNGYETIKNKLKTTEGFLNAFKFINFLYNGRCIHGEHSLFMCYQCYNITYNRMLQVFKIPVELVDYICLYPRLTILINNTNTEIIMTKITKLDQIKEKNDSIDHLNQIRPIIDKIFAFYDASKKKGLYNDVINDCEDNFIIYREFIKKDYNIVRSFEELDKIAMEINGMDETDGTKNEVNEGKEDIEGAPSAPPM